MVKTKKNKKHLKIVSFDDEIIKKDSADKLLSKVDKKSNSENVVEPTVEKENEIKLSKNGLNNNGESNDTVIIKRKTKKAKKQKGNTAIENNNGSQETFSEIKVDQTKRKFESNEKQDLKTNDEKLNENMDESEEKKVKQKKRKKINASETVEQPAATDEPSVENPKVKTEESIRAQKRKKHAKLLEEKRLKTELSAQQNTLNYLSKWKHCRNEWKFEKLKQIWLQQNLFDTSKIPNEFWETAVEYFTASKGFIRNVILRDALKIIEKEESTEEENTDENYLSILNRARDIVQNLQE